MGKSMIQIEGLTKVYQEGQGAALSGIDLEIAQGDIFGVIGMSGAGKSTLLRCISLLESPTSGSISVDGKNLSQIKGRELQELRKQVGVIFQGYNLLMQRTVGKNIAFPLELNKIPKEQQSQRVQELLRIVGLEEKENNYPAQLSGGQRQRVAIARALADNPKVLLCDEPTSALDPLTTRSILKLLKDINQQFGVTVVIITHEIAVVRAICNRVAVLDNGQIAEEGIAKEILSNPKTDVTKLLLGEIDDTPNN